VVVGLVLAVAVAAQGVLEQAQVCLLPPEPITPLLLVLEGLVAHKQLLLL
jgi:hypothetical protein